MKRKFVQIDAKGLEQLQQLLHEADVLVEQLQNKITEISNCELDISAQKTKDQVS